MGCISYQPASLLPGSLVSDGNHDSGSQAEVDSEAGDSRRL